MAFDKVRIRFRKGGDLRLVSHHDLMRCFERMLRRAALPFRTTAGFHPTPRLVFALSLPLGVVGHAEVAELELTEPVEPDEVRRRLAREAPAGLDILDVRRIDPRLTGRVRRTVYRLPLPPDRTAGLAGRCGELLAHDHLWFERRRPGPKRVDLRPSIESLAVGPDSLEMTLCATPTVTARADELLSLLHLDDLLDAGAVLERAALDLDDETPQSPPRGPAEPPPARGAIPPHPHAQIREGHA
jgi:radical SAM-linked protein